MVQGGDNGDASGEACHATPEIILTYHNCPRSESGIPIFVPRSGICQRRKGVDFGRLGNCVAGHCVTASLRSWGWVTGFGVLPQAQDERYCDVEGWGGLEGELSPPRSRRHGKSHLHPNRITPISILPRQGGRGSSGLLGACRVLPWLRIRGEGEEVEGRVLYLAPMEGMDAGKGLRQAQEPLDPSPFDKLRVTTSSG